MIPQTFGRQYNIGKMAPIQCVKNDTLKDLNIKNSCFLMLIIHEGSAYFKIGELSFEAVGPCVVCFDEREKPKLVKKRGVKCDSIYFHPVFLNVNMTFDRVRSDDYEYLAQNHDMFLLKPFTDERRFVYPLFEDYINRINLLFDKMEEELKEQHDWYWSCRSRSFFIEMMLILERLYGIIGHMTVSTTIKQVRNPHLKNAVVFIESHYQESITLSDITKAAAINHSTLTNLFKSELDVTPMEYVWQYRISVAKKFLEFTEIPIKDIYSRCGFKTIQHFSRKFEETTHDLPTVFREKAVARRKSDF